VSRATISPEHWPVIQARTSAGESLRFVAADYGVSHEAIRQIVHRASAVAAD
jgi:hypothetical protein